MHIKKGARKSCLKNTPAQSENNAWPSGRKKDGDIPFPCLLQWIFGDRNVPAPLNKPLSELQPHLAKCLAGRENEKPGTVKKVAEREDSNPR